MINQIINFQTKNTPNKFMKNYSMQTNSKNYLIQLVYDSPKIN